MAYIIDLRRQCYDPACSRTATHEVRDNRNGTINQGCERHAKALAQKLTDQGR